MNVPSYQGLFFATYSPMHADRSLNLNVIPDLVEYNIQSGAAGLYLCGTTGEGMSLSTQERKDICEAFIKAVSGRIPVIVQVGHNAIPDACDLARHAEASGAQGISAHPPTYYKVEDVESLVELSKQVAAASPTLPFYYYHIPSFTGAHFSMKEFSIRASNEIPTFGGIKFSDSRIDFLKQAMDACHSDLNWFWGCDEMLFSGLSNGIHAAVGSTYNVFAREFYKVIDHFNNGNLEEAQKAQLHCTKLISTVAQFPFHAAMKSLITRFGVPCGPTRLPNLPMTPELEEKLFERLRDLNFEVPNQ